MLLHGGGPAPCPLHPCLPSAGWDSYPKPARHRHGVLGLQHVDLPTRRMAFLSFPFPLPVFISCSLPSLFFLSSMHPLVCLA